jgi:hypothetical protein
MSADTLDAIAAEVSDKSDVAPALLRAYALGLERAAKECEEIAAYSPEARLIRDRIRALNTEAKP